jgi:predicted phosphodiesterase
MKLAVFSDIHGNYQATKAILEDINKNHFDKVICLGDIIGIGPKPKETLELILNSNIDIVLGNHELYYTKGLEIDDKITKEDEIKHHHWVHECIKDIPKEKINFPLFKEISINGKKIIFQHYMLSKNTSINPYPFETISIKNMKDIDEYCKNMEYDYMFIGHEHRAFEVHKNNKHIICVGSSGCVNNKTFYTVIEINDDIKITKKEIEFDKDVFINDLKSYNYPDRDFICNVLLRINI